MDLSKAFDCLPHALLIPKLRAYGVSFDICQLLASYLSNRRQRVKIANTRSSWRETSKGVPQGSGLGPLLFNVFINDIFYFVKNSKLLNYADDNTLYTQSHNHEKVIHDLLLDANNLTNWFTNNFMEVNPSKFKIMFLKPRSKKDPFPNEVNLSEVNLPISLEVKLLRVCIDANLSFDNHIKNICRKAARQLNSLKCLHKA